MTDEKGNTYVKKYTTSGTRLMDDVLDYVGSDAKVQDLIDENSKSSRHNKEAAKKWMNSKSDLMNMEISALTKKSEIRKVYRG